MELLAVMAVIAVLLSLASVGVSRMSTGQGLSSGVSIADAVFSEARGLAISRGTQVRVAIHADLDDQDEVKRRRYKRMMMIMIRDLEKESGEEVAVWKPASQATTLPDQVYFSSRLSSQDIYSQQPVRLAQMKLGKQEEDTAQCYYYEFNPQGGCTTPGATFILEAGSRPPNQPDVVSGKEKNRGGFVIWRNGNTAPIRDTSKLEVLGES